MDRSDSSSLVDQTQTFNAVLTFATASELLTRAFGVALAESVRVVRDMAHARERVAEHEPLGPLGIGRRPPSLAFQSIPPRNDLEFAANGLFHRDDGVHLESKRREH